VIQDTLREKVVNIAIRVRPGGDDPLERPILLGLGVEGGDTTLRPGKLGDVLAMIQEAWIDHSQVVIATTPLLDEDESGVLIEGELEEEEVGAAAAAMSSLYLDDDF
jgi:hypothetical protein